MLCNFSAKRIGLMQFMSINFVKQIRHMRFMLTNFCKAILPPICINRICELCDFIAKIPMVTKYSNKISNGKKCVKYLLRFFNRNKERSSLNQPQRLFGGFQDLVELFSVMRAHIRVGNPSLSNGLCSMYVRVSLIITKGTSIHKYITYHVRPKFVSFSQVDLLMLGSLYETYFTSTSD